MCWEPKVIASCLRGRRPRAFAGLGPALGVGLVRGTFTLPCLAVCGACPYLAGFHGASVLAGVGMAVEGGAFGTGLAIGLVTCLCRVLVGWGPHMLRGDKLFLENLVVAGGVRHGCLGRSLAAGLVWPRSG